MCCWLVVPWKVRVVWQFEWNGAICGSFDSLSFLTQFLLWHSVHNLFLARRLWNKISLSLSVTLTCTHFIKLSRCFIRVAFIWKCNVVSRHWQSFSITYDVELRKWGRRLCYWHFILMHIVLPPPSHFLSLCTYVTLSPPPSSYLKIYSERQHYTHAHICTDSTVWHDCNTRHNSICTFTKKEGKRKWRERNGVIRW